MLSSKSDRNDVWAKEEEQKLSVEDLTKLRPLTDKNGNSSISFTVLFNPTGMENVHNFNGMKGTVTIFNWLLLRYKCVFTEHYHAVSFSFIVVTNLLVYAFSE